MSYKIKQLGKGKLGILDSRGEFEWSISKEDVESVLRETITQKDWERFFEISSDDWNIHKDIEWDLKMELQKSVRKHIKKYMMEGV